MSALGGVLQDTMRSAMDDHGLTVSKLARDAGVRRELIYQWWRGEQRPSRSSLARVAKILGIQVDDLVSIYAGAVPRGDATNADIVDAIERQTAVLEQIMDLLGDPLAAVMDATQRRSERRQSEPGASASDPHEAGRPGHRHDS